MILIHTAMQVFSAHIHKAQLHEIKSTAQGVSRHIPLGNAGTLSAFSQINLAPLKQTQYHTDGLFVILPLMGALDVVANDVEFTIAPGESITLSGAVKVSNPYEDDEVIYLLAELNRAVTTAHLQAIDMSQRNTLHTFCSVDAIAKGYLGIYSGRNEELHQITKNFNSIFVFIISGAFEVNNRLLETGDALTMTNPENVDFEALSEDAVILLLEMTSAH